MARLPIMPLLTDAIIADTTRLSPEEFGAYVLILIATWRNNGIALADDDLELSRVARVGISRWRARLKPRLVQFFDISDGCWHQKRLESMWLATLEFSQTQRVKAQSRWNGVSDLTTLENNETEDASASNGHTRRHMPSKTKGLRRTLNVGKGKGASNGVATAPPSPTRPDRRNDPNGPPMPARGDETGKWRTRLGWYLDNPSSWHGDWGPPPTDPRCWLLVAPDCIPYQHLLDELGLRPPP